MRAHYTGTGPEIWHQLNGKIHGFVTSSGTGGTIAGCSKFLKEQDPNIKV
jgi:cysteine synthase